MGSNTFSLVSQNYYLFLLEVLLYYKKQRSLLKAVMGSKSRFEVLIENEQVT